MNNPAQTNDAAAADRRNLLQSALQALETMEARLAAAEKAAEKARTEPIAIIGMSCRFPGGVDSPESLWQLLRAGRNAVTPLPPDRVQTAEILGAQPLDADGKPIWRGGFLENIDQFEPQFFGITPREAISMDPQHRLLLEVAWEALERAGQAPDQLGGSATGVFVGISTTDYGNLVREGGYEALDAYAATGGSTNVAAGRIAFTLGLQGPCMAIDTACSSSLVAVHLAVQSLRNRDCRMALAGGVNAVLMPDGFVAFRSWGMMAPDGQCKAFDASADGFVRAEGCGLVVCKRLADAIADGDTILAVIRGTAVNQDGRSSGLTVPNGPAQQAMLRQALANSGIAPADVQYIEAHGTGTAIGDPIEVEAIGAVLGQGRSDEQPLFLSSIKTNIGHAESAAGIAGLIKVILSMQHGEIPPHLHLRERSPQIPWPDFPIEIPTAPTPWHARNGVRIAGVSGFGFSGTNAHIVLASPPAQEAAPPPQEAAPTRHLLTLSARSDAALSQMAGNLAHLLTEQPDLTLADVAYTLNTGRAHFAHRLALAGESTAQIAERLATFAAGGKSATVVSGQAPSGNPARIAFLFTGQGAQYAAMGKTLYASAPAFRAALDRCAALLAEHVDIPLLDLLFGAATDRLDQTQYTQPALFCLEYALSDLWRSWGVTPHAVMGHSVGEYVAAVVAGVMSLEDGIKLIAARGRLMQSLPAGGAMATIFAPVAQVEAALANAPDGLAIAAINGPEHTVISGAAAAVETVVEYFAQRGSRTQKLVVSHAFHSALMDPILDTFERLVAGVTLRKPRITLISNLSGEVAGDEITTPAYWRRHLREAVRFNDGVEALLRQRINTFVEIGPQPTLLGMAQTTLAAAENAPLSVPSLRKGRDDMQQMLGGLGALFVRGVALELAALYGTPRSRKLVLPTYPFQRARYWVDLQARPALAPKATASAADTLSGNLLGAPVPLAHDPNTHLWQGPIDIASFPYLVDHRVEGIAVFPATGYMEVVMAAAHELFGAAHLAISDIEYEKMLTLGDETRATVQLALHRVQENEFTFQIHSRTADAQAWVRHASGRLKVSSAAQAALPTVDLAAIQARCTEEVDGATFYNLLAERGNQWGPTFQGVERLWRGDGEALALVRVRPELAQEFDNYRFHPAVADACGHVLTATIPMQKSDDARGKAFVGGGIGETRLFQHPQGEVLWAYARRHPDTAATNVLTGDVQVLDAAGVLISETLDAKLWYLEHETPRTAANAEKGIFYQLQWEARPRMPETIAAGDAPWLIFADARGVGQSLATTLTQQGGSAIVVAPGAAYAQLDADRFAILPGDAEEMQRLLAQVAADHPTLQGIVHLWSVDIPQSPSLAADDLDAAQSSGSLSVIHLVQAVTKQAWAQPPRLWLVTQGAQADGSAPAAVAQAPLWGLGRAIALEHSELWGGLLDIDPRAPAATAATDLLHEVTAQTKEDQKEDQIALHNGQRLVARLARLAPLARPALRFHADAAYLITGGLGGLGLAVAQWMAERGARHLLLLGRTPLPPRAQWQEITSEHPAHARIAALRALEEMGVTVHLAAVDVADEAQLGDFLATWQSAGKPALRGVMHAAGVLEHRSILETTASALQATLRAKVRGGWLLHRLLREGALDFFVLFSSASAVLSSPRLSGYAAANAFLDALARHRASLGLPALSINWGVWAEAGMATRFASDDVAAISLRGMGTITTGQGLDALERLMAQGAPNVAVLPADWQRWQQLYPALADAPLLEHLMQRDLAAARKTSSAPFTPEALRAAAQTMRQQMLAGYLPELVADVIGADAAAMDADQPLNDMGVDSLMTVELKNRIELDTGVIIPMVRLLEGPSIKQLVATLVNLVEATTDVTMTPPAAEGAQLNAAEMLENLDTLSNDEVDELLSQLLAAQE